MSMMNTESFQVEKEKWEMHSTKCVADDMQTQSCCMQTMTNIELELETVKFNYENMQNMNIFWITKNRRKK